MKKSAIILLSLAASLTLSAAPVGPQQAVGNARKFFRDNANSGMTLVRTGYQTKPVLPYAPDNAPTFYVYNRVGGGWVIIAADDTVDPVLAYSLTGEFPSGELAPNLKYWLDNVYSNPIAYNRASGVPSVKTSAPTPKTSGDEVTYETALWDQGGPYNDECPMIKGERAITGCIATAMAIKLRFHEWPYRASGTTPEYQYNSGETGGTVTIPANKLGRVYDYSNMPLKYGGGATDDQKAAVAALMHDCGTSMFMMYGAGASGAYSENYPNALKTYFHYSQSVHQEYKDSYPEDKWIEMLKKELKEVGPILCTGASQKSGGHAYVFDGYNSLDQFRINWGWSGSANGWFKITNLNPNGYNFNEGQDAILGCVPDKNGIYTPDEISEMVSLKYENSTFTFSCTMKADFIITKDGANVFQAINVAQGTPKSVTVANLGGKGVYNMLVRLSDFYVEFPDSQYSFEIEL